MQPMIAVFDMANNHDYKNTNEFKLNVSPGGDDRKVLPADAKIDLLEWKSKDNVERLESENTENSV